MNYKFWTAIFFIWACVALLTFAYYTFKVALHFWGTDGFMAVLYFWLFVLCCNVCFWLQVADGGIKITIK